MTASGLTVRLVTPEDCRLLWEWANERDVRASAFATDPIPYTTHVDWFARRQTDLNCVMFIVTDRAGDHPIAQVRFDLQPDGIAEISISVAREARGKGYGVQALRLACDQLCQLRRVTGFVGYVKPANKASVRTFERAGFVNSGLCTIHEHCALAMRQAPGLPQA